MTTFKDLYQKYALRFLSTFCLCSGFVLNLNVWLGSELNGFVLCLASLLFTGFFAAFDYFGIAERNLIFYAVFAGAAALIIAFILLAEVPVMSAFNWLLYSRAANRESAVVYSFISQIILLFAVAGAVFNLLRFKIVRLAAGAVLFILFLVMAIMQRNIGKPVLLFVYIFFFSVLHELLLSRKGRISALTHLLPFVIIAGMVTTLMPSKHEPIQWSGIRSIIRGIGDIAVNISERIMIMFDSSGYEFTVNMTGYNESGHIGGGIAPSEREALLIKNNRNPASHLYLTGSIMDSYTGSEWLRTESFDDFMVAEYDLEKLEVLLALIEGGLLTLPPEERDDIYAVREIEVTYLDIRTRTVFYPRLPLGITIGPAYEFDANGSTILFAGIEKRGTSYRISYIDFNVYNEMLARLLENPPAVSDSEHLLSILYRDFISNASSLDIPKDYHNVLETRRERIRAVYTELPDTVTDRTRELALAITADYGSDYAKMSAIEAYLSAVYTYTRSPKAAGNGDFVDAFLFETGEGYCTYFATAAAVLGRAAGIPTRYVQGYLAVNENGEDDGLIVSENNAHAWVEAYIDSVGWFVFEPSPAFNDMRSSWRSDGVMRTGTAISRPIADTPTYDFNQSNRYPQFEPPEEPENKHSGFYLITVITGIAIMFIAIIAVFTGVYLSARRSRRLYRSAPPTTRFLLDYNVILMLHSLWGEKPQTGETARTFAFRTGSEKLAEVTRSFEQARYGETELSAEQATTAADYKRQLFKENNTGLVKRLGRLKYYLYLIKYKN